MTSALRSVSDGGRRVLDLILKSDGLSQAEITRALDLAQPTVTRLLRSFQEDGLILASPRQVDRPGHPSVHVALNPQFAYAIGVSMMGDVLSMTLMDFAGRARATRSASMPSMGEKEVTERLAAFKTDIFNETRIDPRRVIGAGVGLSGFFVGERHWQNPPPPLEDWALRDTEPILEQALGLPVAVDNDGTVAAIGESLFGVGRRCANFAYLHLSNGFGGGLICDGKPVRGLNGNAGEFGGIWLLCCDDYPSLDLLRTCVESKGHHFGTVEDMVQNIDASWAGVDTWLDRAVPPFSLLSGILACAIDPQLIVVGGRVPRSIAEALVARISVSGMPHRRRDRPAPLPSVVVAEVSGEPVSIGAAAMALQKPFFA
jgi:predicted NBD/HSP70 family sugar kinase